MLDGPCLHLNCLLYLGLCFFSFPHFVNMSSFEDERHSMSHVSELQGSEEPFLYKVASSNHEKVESPFRVVCWICQLGGPSAPIPTPILVGLVSIASTVIKEDASTFKGCMGSRAIFRFPLLI